MTVNDAPEGGWDISDVRNEANNWTLSSDVQMLEFMEMFSANIISKLNNTSKELEELICFTGEISTKVNNTFNDFNMLSNVQFIESRVYEDDETRIGAAVSQDLPNVNEEDTPEVIGARIKTSVEYGLTVLDAAYHIQDTGSDEETTEVNLMIQAKDPYISRHLPYTIGCIEYCTDDAVGVGRSELSDEDSEHGASSKSESEESDMDDNQPQDTISRRSTISSSIPTRRQTTTSIFDDVEDDIGHQNERVKVFDSIFDSTDEDEPDSLFPDTPVTSPTGGTEEVTPRSMSVSSTKSSKTPKGVPRGAVSILGARTVFEDGKIKIVESEESEPEEVAQPQESPKRTRTKLPVPRVRGIFSSSEDSDSDPPPTQLAPKNTPQSLFDSSPDHPPSTEASIFESTRKGAEFDDLFGSEDEGDMFSSKKASSTKLFSSSEDVYTKNIQDPPGPSTPSVISSDHLSTQPPSPKTKANTDNSEQPTASKTTPKLQTGGLFDSSEDDEMFTSPLARTKTTPPPVTTPNSGGLFSEDDMFSSQQTSKGPEPQTVEREPSPKGRPPIRGLFDDSDSDSEDMFAVPGLKQVVEPLDPVLSNEPVPSSVFDNSEGEGNMFSTEPVKKDKPSAHKNRDNLFDNDDIPDEPPTIGKPHTHKKSRDSLFDEGDDMFSKISDESEKPSTPKKDRDGLFDADMFSNYQDEPLKDAKLSSSNQNRDDTFDDRPDEHPSEITGRPHTHKKSRDSLFGDDSEDLFAGTPSPKVTPNNLNINPVSSHQHYDLFDDEEDGFFEGVTEEKVTPGLFPDNDISTPVEESNTAAPDASPKSNIAQLQSSLNLNPQMLMGGKPPKKSSPVSKGDILGEEDSPTKTQKEDATNSAPNNNISKLQTNLNFNPAMLMGGNPPSREDHHESRDLSRDTSQVSRDPIEEKPAEEPKTAAVLVSLTKGRAKGKSRRPPSRRPAQQGAAQQSPQPSTSSASQPASGIHKTPDGDLFETKKAVDRDALFFDDLFDTSPIKPTPKKEMTRVKPDTLTSSVNRDALFSGDIGEELFGDTSSKTAAPKKDNISVKSSKPTNRMDRDRLFSEDMDDLFSTSTKAKSKPSPTSQSKEMWEIADEDIFQDAPDIEQPKEKTKAKRKNKKQKVDIFDDDFDLFSDISPAEHSRKDKKKPKSSVAKKDSIFDDPLFG